MMIELMRLFKFGRQAAEDGVPADAVITDEGEPERPLMTAT